MHDTTRSLVCRSAVGLALLALLAAPAGAQDHRFALGAGGGWSWPSDITPALPGTLTLEPGWVAGAQLEAWPGSGRVGWRLGGTVMDRVLEEDDVNRYVAVSADLSLMIRLLSAGQTRWMAPYIVLGGGATGFKGRDGTGPVGFGVYGMDQPIIKPLAVAGGGFDLLPSRRLGIRIEAVDRMVFPGASTDFDNADFSPSHQPQVLATLQLRGGRISPAPVVVAAQPAPVRQPAAAARVAEPVAAPEREDRAASGAETDELRTRVEDAQGQLTALTRRVDSLEIALGEVHMAAADAAAAAADARSAVAGASAPVATPAPAPARAGGALFTVQVGAFVEQPTAQMWANRLRGQSLPVFLTEAVVKGQRVNRVRVGALPSLGEADELAELLKARYGWPVWVDRVTDSGELPADAVTATRSFMRSN